MWIRTQDKKKMLLVNSFSITRNFGDKQKFVLMGTIATSSFFGSQSTILGFYRTEFDVLQELDKIQNQLQSSQTGVYEIG